MSKIYCLSDIHGCINEFEYALSLFIDELDKPDVKLVLLGDYVHGDMYGKEIIDKIMSLQSKYGIDKIIALLGNHDLWVIEGSATLESCTDYYCSNEVDNKYIRWISNLPLYYTEGNTIFVHAGIDEEAGDLWQWGTSNETFTMKYPAELGKIEDLDMKVVAGHISTAEIANNNNFHDIYYDGQSHFYIDGSVIESGIIPVLMVDTEEDKYYKVTESAIYPVLPYSEY